MRIRIPQFLKKWPHEAWIPLFVFGAFVVRWLSLVSAYGRFGVGPEDVGVPFIDMAAAVGGRLAVNLLLTVVVDVLLAAVVLGLAYGVIAVAIVTLIVRWWDAVLVLFAIGVCCLVIRLLDRVWKQAPAIVGSAASYLGGATATWRRILRALVTALVKRRRLPIALAVPLVIYRLAVAVISEASDEVRFLSAGAHPLTITAATVLLLEVAVKATYRSHLQPSRWRGAAIAAGAVAVVGYLTTTMAYESRYADALLRGEEPAGYPYVGGPPSALRRVQVLPPLPRPPRFTSASPADSEPCYVLLGSKNGQILLVDTTTRELIFQSSDGVTLIGCDRLPDSL